MKFLEIIEKNNKLQKNLNSEEYSISLLSNIIINQLNPVLEYELRQEGINAKCYSGDYDNIVQDSDKFKENNLVIIFWESANLIDGFQYRSNVLNDTELKEYIERFKREIDLVFTNLVNTKLVIVNKFTSLVFNHHFLGENNFDKICSELNQHLEKVLPYNAIIVDTNKIIAKIGINNSVDFRNYYSSKALYTVDFFKEYASFIKPAVLSISGKAKKALIFDCDNTLWDGIIGEDGINGINMSPDNPKGVVFEEVQFLAKELARKGIIIGLNSKNNSTDVEEVIKSHKDMRLTDDELLVREVNWNDKISNLKKICKDLNIGIDSLVFIDDSDFEIELIKEYLPQVKTIQVPKQKYSYPSEVRRNIYLFYSITFSPEDSKRLTMYKEEKHREAVKSTFSNMVDYLTSLNLEITIYVNCEKLIPRMAQLTQKTNQFNLTTKRYNESEVVSFVKSKDCDVFAFNVKDKFGDFGITGEAFIKIDGDTALWDTLLMSCRVIGRKIEYIFAEEIIIYLKKRGIQRIKAQYIKTPKNEQVKDFYENLGFTKTDFNDSISNYELIISNYTSPNINYINIKYER